MMVKLVIGSVLLLITLGLIVAQENIAATVTFLVGFTTTHLGLRDLVDGGGKRG